ncbi:MAG: hypothetical protein ACYTG0_43260, partial [Planctomycetota bacterium]
MTRADTGHCAAHSARSAAEGFGVDEVLLELLHRLEVVSDAHGELFDSDVREAMDDAVLCGFI